MSKLGKLKLELAKLLAAFSELKTDKGILSWPVEGELVIGYEVYVLDENGEYNAPEDGTYTTEDGKVITIAGGKVEAITEPETEVDPESEAPEVVEEVVETPVEAAEEPVADPETETDGVKETETDAIDGIHREINELYDIVDKLVKKVAELEGKTVEASETVMKMSKMSAAMSAQEEIETNTTIAKSGDSAIDKKLKNFIG